MSTQSEREAFSRRLNQVLDELRAPAKGAGRQSWLGKQFKVSQKGARKWLEGEAIPQGTRLSEMAQRWRLHFEWLATGRGAMWLNGEPGPLDEQRADELASRAEQEAAAIDLARLERAIVAAEDVIKTAGGKPPSTKLKASMIREAYARIAMAEHAKDVATAALNRMLQDSNVKKRK